MLILQMSNDYAFDMDIVQNSDGSLTLKPSFAVELLQTLELTLKFR